MTAIRTPDMNFRFTMFDATTPGYIYNLQTKGMATGSYQMAFYVGSDPKLYFVPFQVK